MTDTRLPDDASSGSDPLEPAVGVPTPDDIAAPAPSDSTPRLWIALASLPILLGVMLQHVGQIIYLTRIDRILDPIAMAARSFVLWNPFGDMGSLQYQSIGYWIPFDAFFSLGTILHVPLWITERLFIAGLMIVGFAGCVRLADAMRIGSRPFRILAGLSYALCAVIIGRVGQQQVFAMGAVFLPWTVIPLVHGAHGGSTRRAAARSGLAIALMGGANAAVVLAMVPVPFLYLLTRARGPRRASLIRWWLLVLPMSIAWWMVSLYFFGKYGPNVLQYTETVATTTGPTPIFEVVRGTADWFAHLTVNGVALPSGNALATRAIPIIGTTLIAALGLGGLAHRRMPERRFLALVLLLGIAAVGGGYGGLFGSPVASQYRALLGGPLGPFRNVYKFEACIALPLALGLAHLLSRAATSPALRRSTLRRAIIPAIALIVIGASAFPLWSNQLMRGRGFTEVPTAWTEARTYLDSAHTGRVLVVPGLGQADFDWGYTQQLPLQWNSDISWATRNQAPLGGPANIAVLDAIERAIAANGDPGLLPYLRRAGFSQVLVASDSSYQLYGAPDPERLVNSLRASGLTPEASFGPTGYGLGQLHQIEVFTVPDPEIARTYASSAAAWLSGDIESVLHVPTATFGERPYVLVSDAARTTYSPFQWLITDGNQRYAINFGRNRNNRTYVLGPLETMLNGQKLTKLQLFPTAVENQTVQTIAGVSSITASSVGPGILDRGLSSAQPANVLDGDPTTSWRPDRLTLGSADDWGTNDQWVDLTFDSPRVVDPASITLDLGYYGNAVPIDVVAQTDAGRVESQLQPSRDPQPLAVPAGPTEHLRITITGDSYHRVHDVIGISELTIPGGPFTRSLRVPSELAAQFADPGTPSPAWVFNRNLEPIARTFEVPRATTLDLLATGSINSSQRILDLIDSTQWLTVAANSTVFVAPTLAPRNLVDHDDSTLWIGEGVAGDPAVRTTVHMTWPGTRPIHHLSLHTVGRFAMPSSITVRAAEGTFDAPVDAAGGAEIPEIVTGAIDIDIHYDAVTDGSRPTEIGFAGIDVSDIEDLYPGPVDFDAPLSFPCGSGPTITIGTTRFDLSLTTTYRMLTTHLPQSLTFCAASTIDLPAGSATISAANDVHSLGVDQIVLGGPPLVGSQLESPRTFSRGSWGSTERHATIGAGSENLFVVNEIFNRGWRATLDGTPLATVPVDGWRQGFVVPAGEGGEITLTFAPNQPYQAGTGAALVLLAAVALMAVVPGSRRRTGPPAVGAGTWPSWLTLTIGAVAAIWITGIGAIVLPVLWLGRRRLRALLPALAAASFTAAGAFALLTRNRAVEGSLRWGLASYPASALAALGVLCVIAVFIDRSGPDPDPDANADEPADTGGSR